MGKDFVGPMPNGETPQQAQVGRPKGYLKGRSAKQIDTETDNQRQAAKDAQAAADKAAEIKRQEARDKETADYHRGLLNKPTAGGQGHYSLQPEIDPKTGAQTGRFLGFNSKTNKFEVVEGVTPTATKAAPGIAKTAEEEKTTKDALGSLDQLDAAIDASAHLIGPGAGRVSNFEQIVGNPDPKLSALGTKLLLAKMRVDHAATGTVRAGASPQILARWDKLTSQNLDAPNLKATVQAMREILGGQAAGQIIVTAPDGSTHPFATQAQADKFKQLAGIK
jgi:hypothetical protein